MAIGRSAHDFGVCLGLTAPAAVVAEFRVAAGTASAPARASARLANFVRRGERGAVP